MLYKFIDVFHKISLFDNDPKADHRYCEICRPKVLKAFEVLEEVLKLYAKDLENVDSYLYANANIATS
jgi:hypothetical protein